MSTIGIKVQQNNVVFAGTQDEVYDPSNNEIKNEYCDGLQIQNRYVRNGGVSTEVLHVYTDGILTWDVAGSAPPLPPETISNAITLTNTTATTATDVPVQIGRQFVEGTIPDFPQVSIADVLYDTQANVKTRWPDGSVKHCVINFVIPSIDASQAMVAKFVNQATTLDTAMTKTEMLAMTWEAKMQLEFPTVEIINARTMLSNDHFEYWLEGPIATSIVLSDHSLTRVYDVGADSYNSVRPIFHITFWPGINKYLVRYIAGNENVEVLQDQTYDLTLMTGTSDMVRYTKTGLVHAAASRWTKQFWGDTAPTELNINHNLPYLISANAFPNYDTSSVIPEAEIVRRYNLWLEADTDLYGGGRWAKNMGNAGGRPDIGVINGYEAGWLNSFDPRMFEIAKGQADLASAWPIWLREGNAAFTYYDFDGTVPAVGMPISISPFGRFYHWSRRGGWDNEWVHVDHRINTVGPYTTAWSADTSHFPNISTSLYLLLGDYYYLEMQLFSATYVLGDSNGQLTDNYGRGPTGSEGGYFGNQARGSAWSCNLRCTTEDLLPDAHPSKAYFKRLNKEMIAFWEGWHGLNQSYPEHVDLYNFAITNVRFWFTKYSGVVAPHGNWNDGYTEYANLFGKFDTTILETASGGFQTSYLGTAFGRAKELGYKTDNLLEFVSRYYRGIFSNVAFEPAMIGAYPYPAVKLDGTWPVDIAEMMSLYQPEYIAETVLYTEADQNALRYDHLAAAHLSFTTALPYGNEAWAYCLATVVPKDASIENPMWAFLPRA
jgi:hypothetical protein